MQSISIGPELGDETKVSNSFIFTFSFQGKKTILRE